MIRPKKPITMTVVPYEPPDHSWDDTLAVAGQWCGICGKEQIVHDGNLDKVFDWMRKLP